MSMSRKFFLYMLFAVICTGINLGSQSVLNYLLSPIEVLNQGLTIFGKTFEYYYIIHLLAGTALGFMAKFLLDKFLVFKNEHQNMGATFKQMIIYGLFAVITTLIFWGFQISFKFIFNSDQISLIGGLLGLTIGYSVKYILDKTWVFKKNEPES